MLQRIKKLFVLFCGVILILNSVVINKSYSEGQTAEKSITFKIFDKKINKVDNRLFGQFLEKASFGEPGPEGALVPGTHKLQPQVVKLMSDMKIPLIRFPGGTDADYFNWVDSIDNAPGMEGEERDISEGVTHQQITNYFGYDEYLRLAEQQKIESILVLNFRDALKKRVTLSEAALNAAGLVAYCNAPAGKKLPKGMPNWPSIRSKNGHPKPYNVRNFQLGNEVSVFADKVMEENGITDVKAKAKWLIACINALVDKMREVDPTIKIILDGDMGKATNLVLSDKSICQKADYVDFHHYIPWNISPVTRDGAEYPIEKITAEEMWNAWVAIPSIDSQGKSVLPPHLFDTIKKVTTKKMEDSLS